jgi:hypothetical protein
VGNNISFANTVSAGTLVTSNVQSLVPAIVNVPQTLMTSATVNGYTATSSSIRSAQNNDQPYQAFGPAGQFGSWKSGLNTYSSSTGAYLGAVSTTVSGSAVTGEWLQLQLPAAVSVTSVSFNWDNSQKTRVIVASLDGSTWTQVGVWNVTAGLPNGSSGYTTVTLTAGTYQYIRFIATAISSNPFNYTYAQQVNTFIGVIGQVQGALAINANVLNLNNSSAMGDAGFGTSYAGFSHSTQFNTANYALLSDNSGTTYVNSASGQNIRFRQNNADLGIWNAGNLNITTSVVAANITASGVTTLNGPTSVTGVTSVSGNVTFTSSNVAFTTVNGGPYTKDYFRVIGSTGVYWQDYGGGWFMQDSTYMRVYADKYIYTGGYIISGSRMGIGTASPAASLEITSGVSYQDGPDTYFDNTTNGLVKGGGANTNTSIHATNRIVCDAAFAATSDRRIKDNIESRDSMDDLRTVQQLCIVNFSYRDVVGHSNALQIGVIAQDVESVFPQCVTQEPGPVPDVYKHMQVTWLDEHQFSVEWGESELPKIDSNLCIIADTTTIKSKVVNAHGNVVTLQSPQPHSAPKSCSRVFVWGTYVEDLRSVEYDNLACLNISATQALARMVQDLQTENAALRTRMESIEARLAAAGF